MDDPWYNGFINAEASQIGREWHLSFDGGLGKIPGLNSDAWTLAVCHELGHHFGGYPFFDAPGLKWASVEGQADYFATRVCARIRWQNETQTNEKFSTNVDPIARGQCDQAWNSRANRNLCYRIATAAQTFWTAYTWQGNFEIERYRTHQPHAKLPRFQTPDLNQVPQTHSLVGDHPNTQCRLDTMLAGAVCRAKIDLNLIPGKIENERHLEAKEIRKAQAPYACENGRGARPACWFAPIP